MIDIFQSLKQVLASESADSITAKLINITKDAIAPILTSLLDHSVKLST